VQRFKKVLRTSELAQNNNSSGDYRASFTGSFTPVYTSATPLPDYLKPYEPNPILPKYTSEESSPFTLNYDAPEYRY
jgi:hypothetical protein